MKRTVAALFLSLLAVSLHAAPQPDINALRNYALKALPRCADPKLMLERSDQVTPAGFVVYTLNLTSSDTTCGKHGYLLFSPATSQIVIGAMFPLPPDNRSLDVRVTDTASELLKEPVAVTVTRAFPLPDGLKPVALMRTTQYGPFAYHGWVDASEQFLIVGTRGNLHVDPAKTLLESLSIDRAVRRGNPKSPVQIIELSDFQCPTCGRAHKVVEPIIEKHLSKINYLRLDLPLFEHHEWSIFAALGARAIQKVAPKQYWSYVNFVFGNQDAITKSPSFDKVLHDFCDDHDISWSAVQKIYQSANERAELMDQVSRAFETGIASTPTYIINGQVMGYGPDGKFMLSALKKALGEK